MKKIFLFAMLAFSSIFAPQIVCEKLQYYREPGSFSGAYSSDEHTNALESVLSLIKRGEIRICLDLKKDDNVVLYCLKGIGLQQFDIDFAISGITRDAIVQQLQQMEGQPEEIEVRIGHRLEQAELEKIRNEQRSFNTPERAEVLFQNLLGARLDSAQLSYLYTIQEKIYGRESFDKVIEPKIPIELIPGPGSYGLYDILQILNSAEPFLTPKGKNIITYLNDLISGAYNNQFNFPEYGLSLQFLLYCEHEGETLRLIISKSVANGSWGKEPYLDMQFKTPVDSLPKQLDKLDSFTTPLDLLQFLPVHYLLENGKEPDGQKHKWDKTVEIDSSAGEITTEYKLTRESVLKYFNVIPEGLYL